MKTPKDFVVIRPQTFLKCGRCQHEWISRVETPVACPKCRSIFWNRERVRPAKGEQQANTSKPHA